MASAVLTRAKRPRRLIDVEDDWRHARGLVIGAGTPILPTRQSMATLCCPCPAHDNHCRGFQRAGNRLLSALFSACPRACGGSGNNKKLDISQLLRVWSQTVRCLGLSPQRSRCCLRRSRCRACPGMFSRIIMAMRRRSLRPRSREVSRYCLSVRRLRQNYQRNMEKRNFL